MVADPFKEFAGKTLERYQNERPFALDPDKANAEDKKAAELEGKDKKQVASKSM